MPACPKQRKWSALSWGSVRRNQTYLSPAIDTPFIIHKKIKIKYFIICIYFYFLVFMFLTPTESVSRTLFFISIKSSASMLSNSFKVSFRKHTLSLTISMFLWIMYFVLLNLNTLSRPTRYLSSRSSALSSEFISTSVNSKKIPLVNTSSVSATWKICSLMSSRTFFKEVRSRKRSITLKALIWLDRKSVV